MRHPQRGMAGRDTSVDDLTFSRSPPIGLSRRSNRKKGRQRPKKNGYCKPSISSFIFGTVPLHKSPYIGPRDIAAFKLARIRSRDRTSSPISFREFQKGVSRSPVLILSAISISCRMGPNNPSREKNREDDTSEKHDDE